MSNHELKQIFFNGLGPQDKYRLDAASGGTFIRKYEDEAMELIEMMAENSHHNAKKPIQKRCDAERTDDRCKISGDMHASRKNWKNGESSESPSRPTQHPQRF